VADQGAGRPVALSPGPPLAGLDPATYRRSPLHADDRIWTETNCYTDLWIELLHALGLEPLAVAAFTLSTDFEGTQWSFIKPPLEDLRSVYGIEVAEMNVWRPVLDHVEEELGLGRLLTVEVDAWHLPDTVGVSYRSEHTKTSIVPQMVDRADRVLRYFHGAGFHELRDADFDGVFAPSPLPPYVERIRVDRLVADVDAQLAAARRLTVAHLDRRPADNPVERLGRHLEAGTGWLGGAGVAGFHRFAFGTCRQWGATAEIAASYATWLGGHSDRHLERAAGRFFEVAIGAKSVQFTLARLARGRAVEVSALFPPLARAWKEAMADVERASSASLSEAGR
jgi:hypothetical protein